MTAGRRVGALVAALTLVACARAGNDSAALAAEVRRLIGDAACTADDQCRTLAFGAKACGGPQAYLAWSTRATVDPAALAAAAERHAAVRREELRRSGLMSDCRLVTDPGAVCLPTAAASAPAARACQLRSGLGSANLPDAR